jgi:2,4-dienoyl-CoA reductase-like NADH-dependent reductase (Old Yellow Enzyme family)
LEIFGSRYLCRYTAETAEAAISRGDADLISFGRLYLSNPDLPDRIANGWPLAELLPRKYWFFPFAAYRTTEGYVVPKYSQASKL